jgi:hypothetical protein
LLGTPSDAESAVVVDECDRIGLDRLKHLGEVLGAFLKVVPVGDPVDAYAVGLCGREGGAIEARAPDRPRP